MAETRRIAIIDKDGANKLASVIESSTTPWVYWLVILKPDWTPVWTVARWQITGTLSNQTDLQTVLDTKASKWFAIAMAAAL